MLIDLILPEKQQDSKGCSAPVHGLSLYLYVMSSTTCPLRTIHDLPAEVLLKIFRAYVDLSQDRAHRRLIHSPKQITPPPPMVLTYVCRTWRRYGIGDPSLWTTICIDGDTISKSASLFLERSTPLLFDLIVRKVETFRGWEITVGKILKQVGLGYPMQKRDAAPANRLRSLRIGGLYYSSARDLVSMLEQHKLPNLSELSIHPCDSECPIPGDPFLPLLRPSIMRMDLVNCSRQLNAESLEKIITSCPLLEILVIGRMGIHVELPQGGGSFDREAPVIRAPKLKVLAVASPMTFESQPSCRPGCPCFFRNLQAENLTYLEVAGDVGNALCHLLPLIKRNSTAKRYSTSTTTGTPNSLLTIVLNVGGGCFEYEECDDLLPFLPPNIHLRLFFKPYRAAPSPVMEACVAKMASAVVYRSKLSRGTLDDPLSDDTPRVLEDWEPVFTFQSVGDGDAPTMSGLGELPYLNADQDSDEEIPYLDDDDFCERWGAGDSDWDEFSSGEDERDTDGYEWYE